MVAGLVVLMASKFTLRAVTRLLVNPGSQLPLRNTHLGWHNHPGSFFAPIVRLIHKSSSLTVQRSNFHASDSAASDGVKNQDNIQGQSGQEKDLSRALINSLALEEIDLNLYR